jgi:4-amino-4-deoxy-L-arabinose transferase-like glycosyltransferase
MDPRIPEASPSGSGGPEPKADHFSGISLSFLLAGVVVRVVCFMFSTNIGGDALSRAEITSEWLQNPSWRPDAFGAYLPLHFWLMAIPDYLLGDAELGGRLVSVVLGTASLYLFWLCARELFEERAADYSLIVFALYAVNVGYSTNSSSEAPYLFFLLGGLTCFFSFRRSEKYSHLVLSGLCMTLASAIRCPPCQHL